MKKSQGFRRPRRIKKKKSILKNRFFWLGVFISAIIILISYLLLFHSFFRIEKIDIFNNEKVEKEMIEDLVERAISKKILFFSSKSIFLINEDSVRKNILNNFPEIKGVSLEKDFPRTLKIKIEERKPVAVFCQSGLISFSENFGIENEEYFFIDKEGIIYEKTEKSEMLKIKNLTLDEIFKLGDRVIEKEQLEEILHIQSTLKNDLDIQIDSVDIASERRLNVNTLEGWQIYFNIQKDIDWQLTELKLVLDKKILPEKREKLEYVDLRFEEVFYK